jgi:hypothetical protein
MMVHYKLPKAWFRFKQNPVYTTNKISFSIQIQFGGGGKAVDIEYKLLDGSSVIASGKSSADTVIPMVWSFL